MLVGLLPYFAVGKVVLGAVFAPGDYLTGTDALAETPPDEEESEPSPYLTSVAGGLTVAAILGLLG